MPRTTIPTIRVVPDGTRYPGDAPRELIAALEDAKWRGVRVHVRLGDAVTGRDWLHRHDCEGYVRRSTGVLPAPILVYNARSRGGRGLLVPNVVRVAETRAPRRVLYEHPRYHLPAAYVRRDPVPAAVAPDGWGDSWTVDLGLGPRAGAPNFPTRERAEAWIAEIEALLGRPLPRLGDPAAAPRSSRAGRRVAVL